MDVVFVGGGVLDGTVMTSGPVFDLLDAAVCVGDDNASPFSG